ncbi:MULTISPECIES: hypothetical protein [Thalassobaculum]|uniref:Uncharacterized protein n=1 Tax=Thalassobaculum litoreum DSM 18839 TaxID=1123362 RepID=A0A8G2BJY3_9PROT|nr:MULTISPECIES: hypothetical protein [Thalassobaculum]SDG11931.1 hypothetical protein SAMN05660686_03453 [Thalassobaculum litoreum DSM 18839]
MSGSSPWSIKGVSREDREVAKHEARKSGEPIGAWLSRRIREASAGGAPVDGRQIVDRGSLDAPDRQPDPSARAVSPENDRRRGGPVQGDPSLGRRATDHPDFGFGPGNWRQARETILAREESRHTEGLAALRDRVRAVEGRLETKPDDIAELDQRIRSISGRIAELTDRLEALENTRGLGDVDRKMDRLETEFLEMDRFVRRIPADTSDSLDGLARRIEQLVDRMRVVEAFVLPGKRKPGFFGRLFRRKSR